ncbi:tripartite motif-containing protein 10-like isoform X2 [Hoplias malabaricus]|uniref:tripartite motif-containing protein 10-like isoform X2 n=1 Tax=Hoplias malabaricus TaxID=27720 RepID=UPI003462373A
MASMLHLQIQCPVCLNTLRDPVCLPCEHFYCRACITRHFAVNSVESTCPECRNPFHREDIRVNRALKNIVDAARDHLEQHETLREGANTLQSEQNQNSTEQCPVHFETFRFFCETDKKLLCQVCREDERHQGHRVKPLSDALQAKKEKAVENLENIFSENERLVNLIESQADEIIKTREKSKALSHQISEQFKKMHKFLSDKEEEVKALLMVEEDKLLENMEINLFTMEEILSEVRVNQGILMSALETDQPCQFLQWWTESGQSLIRETETTGGL